MTALYRAYRPQRFDDVVGQDTVVRTLRNAILSGRVAHAYLFTGSKGTGKTTMAKLLAKSMNCVQGPTTDPCGECENCVAIAEGRSLDVAEIDAASNNGVDAVREKIIDTVAFRPASGTRRVYILDEAHMLTPAAFNALLKTIEEPPDHVIFVFCTTETHKMMATVRDRCQRLTFAPATAENLLSVLTKVSATEGIEADEAALGAIARVSQGSYRNALGTLELLATSFDRRFTRDDVLAHLGVLGEETMFEAADAVLAADAARILTVIEGLSQRGTDLAQFAGALAEHLRALLLALHGVDGAALLVGDASRLAEQAGSADEARVLATLDALSDALTRIRIGSDPRLALETALVRAAQGLGLSAISLRLARLEQGATGSYGQPLASPQASSVVAAAPTPVPAPHPVATALATPAPAEPGSPAAQLAAAMAPAAKETVAPTPAPDPTPAPARVVRTELSLSAVWEQLQARATGPTHALIVAASPKSFDGERLVLGTSQIALFQDKQRSAIRALLEAIVGTPVRLDVEELVAIPTPATSESEAASELDSTVSDDDTQRTLELLQQTFDATELSAN